MIEEGRIAAFSRPRGLKPVSHGTAAKHLFGSRIHGLGVTNRSGSTCAFCIHCTRPKTLISVYFFSYRKGLRIYTQINLEGKMRTYHCLFFSWYK